MSTLAQRLRTARDAAGVTQRDLARRIGIRQQTISLIERGESEGTRHLVAIANELGVEPDWLQTGQGPMHPQGFETLVDLTHLDDPTRRAVRQLVSALEQGELDAELFHLLVARLKTEPPRG